MAVNPSKNLQSIVGVGWKYPFRISGQKGGVAVQGRNEDIASMEKIRESLKQILSVFVGERVILRTFGNELFDLLFEGNDEILDQSVKQFIQQGIAKHEKRIILNNISILDKDVDSGKIEIYVGFTVASTYQTGNLVYPLYLDKITSGQL